MSTRYRCRRACSCCTRNYVSQCAESAAHCARGERERERSVEIAEFATPSARSRSPDLASRDRENAHTGEGKCYARTYIYIFAQLVRSTRVRKHNRLGRGKKERVLHNSQQPGATSRRRFVLRGALRSSSLNQWPGRLDRAFHRPQDLYRSR